MSKHFVTIINLPDRFEKRVAVTGNLFCHLCPDLKELCSLRDTFWRLTVNDYGLISWWKIANEAEALIENLAPDYSI